MPLLLELYVVDQDPASLVEIDILTWQKTLESESLQNFRVFN